MNFDATDMFLIFAYIITALLIIGSALVRAVYREGVARANAAHREGFDAGKRHGILWEKNRRRRVEDRVEARIEAQLRVMEGKEWPREIDTEKPPFMQRPEVRRYLDRLDDLEEK